MNNQDSPQLQTNFNCESLVEETINKRKQRLESLIRIDKYCLPFIFALKVNYSFLNNDVKGMKIAKCEGILCYQNGYPVSLKRWRFFALNYSKNLSKLYYICRQTYNLKFAFSFQESSLLSLSNEEILIRSQTKLQENMETLYQFLIKLGLMRHNHKSINRLRCIYAIKALKKEMDDILNLHQNAYDPQSEKKNISEKQPQMIKQKQNYGSAISQQTNQTMTQTSSVHQFSTLTLSQNLQRFPEKPRKCCRKQFKTNKQDYQIKNEVDSPLMKINKIEMMRYDKNGKPQENSGAYYLVKKYEAAATFSNEQLKNLAENQRQKMNQESEHNEQTQKIKIAVKQLRKQFQGNPKYLQKIEHELNIVRQIKNSQYICRYYEIEKDAQKNQLIYMESMVVSLKQILSKGLSCNYFQIIKQLLASVCSLHESGIVHRDIKPGNIMFDFNGQLKLIDFSQSIQCWKKLEKQMHKNVNIGFTLPYSPLECSFLSIDGYSNMKIDNWSVGMTVIQVLLGSLPVCYSKSMGSSIKSGWGTQQFHWCMNLRRSSLVDELLFPLKIMCLKLMRFQAKERLCLESVYNYLRVFEKLLF